MRDRIILLTIALLPTILNAEESPWKIVDGWAIKEDMRSADPAKYKILCQSFLKGDYFSNEILSSQTSVDEIEQQYPDISRFIGIDNRFWTNVVLEIE